MYQEATIPENSTFIYVAGMSPFPKSYKVKFLCGSEKTNWVALSVASSVADHLQAMPQINTRCTQGSQDSFRKLLEMRSKRSQKVSFSFLELLQTFRRTRCQDPRDKVYAPLCLASDVVTKSIIPDYLNKNVLDVHLEVAAFGLTQHGRNLHFLGFAVWPHDTTHSLQVDLSLALIPSWLPNWLEPVEICPIPKTIFKQRQQISSSVQIYDRRGTLQNDEEQLNSYNATDSSSCTAKIVNLQFHIDAIFVDTISDVMPLTGPDAAAIAKTKCFNWGKASKESYPTGEKFADALKRTQVMDLSYDWRSRPCSRGATLDFAFLKKPREQLDREQYERQSSMRIAFNHATRGRVMCFTKKGCLGMLPASATVGDDVFAFLGGQVLYTVRRASPISRDCTYIGETYIHGLMDGEILTWLDGRQSIVEDLVLI